MVPLLVGERGVIGGGVFCLLLLVEAVRPFKRPPAAHWRHLLINLFITGSNALLLTVLLGGLIISLYQAFEWHRVGLLHTLGITGWVNVAATVVVLDGVTYWWHRAYHQRPFLWRMHRVHHSDQELDVTSSGRFHLAEMVLSAVFRLGVIAALGASVASVVIFEVVFGVFNQLEHANLRLPPAFDRALRTVVVTPDMHRVHHSQVKAETNSNYGTVFSCWDRLFGTYRVADQLTLAIGLPEYGRVQDVTLGKVLAMPFGPSCASMERASGLQLASAR